MSGYYSGYYTVYGNFEKYENIPLYRSSIKLEAIYRALEIWDDMSGVGYTISNISISDEDGEAIPPEEWRRWYAVHENENDHYDGNGSFEFDEAKEMLSRHQNGEIACLDVVTGYCFETWSHKELFSG